MIKKKQIKHCPSCNSTRYKHNYFSGGTSCAKCGYHNKKDLNKIKSN